MAIQWIGGVACVCEQAYNMGLNLHVGVYFKWKLTLFYCLPWTKSSLSPQSQPRLYPRVPRAAKMCREGGAPSAVGTLSGLPQWAPRSGHPAPLPVSSSPVFPHMPRSRQQKGQPGGGCQQPGGGCSQSEIVDKDKV